MNYEWDEQKNEINIAKHGIDFADAYLIFLLPTLTALDDRFDYGEPDEEARRIISVRKVLQDERNQYEQFVKEQRR